LQGIGGAGPQALAAARAAPEELGLWQGSGGADQALVAKRKWDELLGRVTDVGLHREAQRRTADGCSDEVTATQLHAGEVQRRVS
jgi:hypothetical protein